MRVLALLTLSFVFFSAKSGWANLVTPQKVPQTFKIWGDSGKLLLSDQNNVLSEMIELEYLTVPRKLAIIEVSIKDANGQLMAKRIISSDGGNLHSRIGLHRWPEGNYFVQVWIEGQEMAYPIEIVKAVAGK